MKAKNIRYQILRETLFAMQICCNLNPEEMRERKKEVEELLPCAGTRNGWKIELDDESVAPVKCSDDEGYWHYIAYC